MPRFYSPEWAAAFNEAVADLDVQVAQSDASAPADPAPVRVVQEILDAPLDLSPDGEGRVRGHLVVALVIEGGRLRLSLGSPGDARAADEGDPDVTVVLSYADAVALSRGELDAARALGAGRIRVRGNLTVLLSVEEILGAAGTRMAGLQAATTY